MSIRELDLTPNKVFSRSSLFTEQSTLHSLVGNFHNNTLLMNKMSPKSKYSVSSLKNQYGFMCIRCGKDIYYNNKDRIHMEIIKLDSKYKSEETYKVMRELCHDCGTDFGEVEFDVFVDISKKHSEEVMINHNDLMNKFKRSQMRKYALDNIESISDMCSEERLKKVMWARKHNVDIWN